MDSSIVLPVSAQNLLDFIPKEYEGHPNPLTYILRVPSDRLEGLVRHTMISTVGVMPPDDVMYAELRKALKELLAESPDDLKEVLEVVEKMEAANAAMANLLFSNTANKAELMDQVDEEMVESFTRLVFTVAREWPPYRHLLADRTFYYSQIYPVSARVYVVDVKNADFELKSERGMLYWYISKLQRVDKETEKNLESPLKSQQNPEPSAAVEK